MQELIEQLEKATGPDYRLSCAIYIAISGYRTAEVISLADGDAPASAYGSNTIVLRRTVDGCAVYHKPPHYTDSIDATLALLPPWSWRVGNLPSGRGFADLGTQASLQCVEGATPAIALCIAALKAKAQS